jgi:Tfp pilus assembly protein PilE
MAASSSRGVTLVDLAMLMAVAAVFASVALPSYQLRAAQGRRVEAIEALMKLRAAQEHFRTVHGRYALHIDRLAELAPRGAHYDVALVASHGSGYIARARSTAGVRDDGCAELTLAVIDGVTTHGPSERCWSR